MISLFQFATIGNTFTFKITTMNIGMHYALDIFGGIGAGCSIIIKQTICY